MIKICFAVTVFVTYKAFLTNLVEYLQSTGEYDISLICNKEDGMEEVLQDYVHYFPVDMKRGISLSAFSSIKQIEEIIKNNNFDIVQYSTPNAAFYTSIAAKKHKVPVRLYCQWGIRYMGFEGVKRSIFKFLEKITCKNSTHIEAESFNIRQFSLDEKLYTEEKSSVIWNGSASGVDLSKFDYSQKEKWRREIREKYNISDMDVVLAFSGRLTADKGVNELLTAFLNIEEKKNNVKLLIMGWLDDNTSLNQELMERAKKSDNIIFTGFVNDVERYYAASDMFIAPSYREGFGLVVIEAEAMGLPAIVSDVPGQIDAIEPGVTGLSCVVKDYITLQAAMETLIDDKSLRAKLGEGALNFAKDKFEQKKLFSFIKQQRDKLIVGR